MGTSTACLKCVTWNVPQWILGGGGTRGSGEGVGREDGGREGIGVGRGVVEDVQGEVGRCT